MLIPERTNGYQRINGGVFGDQIGDHSCSGPQNLEKGQSVKSLILQGSEKLEKAQKTGSVSLRL